MWPFLITPLDKAAENKLAREGNERIVGRGFFSPSLAPLIQQNGNGPFAFPNANANNCSDRFVIADTASLPQHKLLYVLKMPLTGF